MTWWQLALAIYAIGFVMVLAFFWLVARRDEAVRGASALTNEGCIFAPIWPLVLIWLVIVGIAYALACLRDEVLSWRWGRKP